MVSVILPNFNYKRHLSKRIDSIFQQTYQDFELIILDDASTDGSQALIENYKMHPKVSKVVLNKINSGSPFPQWKKGIEKAKGDIIWIAEADDFVDPKFIETLLPKFEHKNIGLAYTHSYEVNEKDEIKGLWNIAPNNIDTSEFATSLMMKGQDFIKKYLIHWNVIPNASGVLFRKEVYQSCGGIDPSIERCADWHLWIKMLLHSDVYFHYEPLNYFRRHPDSVIGKFSSKSSDTYSYRYDTPMRKALSPYLVSHKKIAWLNDWYINMDLGYEGIWDLNDHKKLSGIRKIFQSFIKTGFNFLPIINLARTISRK